jgi:hypothetical protein
MDIVVVLVFVVAGLLSLAAVISLIVDNLAEESLQVGRIDRPCSSMLSPSESTQSAKQSVQ